MGLLDMMQNDPEKREALRQGLLAAGAQMMAGGRQDLGTSIGQGLGSGVNTYASQREQYKMEAEKARQRQAQQSAIQAAMMPGRPALPQKFSVGGNPYATRDAAQAAAMPNQNTQLMAGAMGSQAQPPAIEEVPGQAEQAGGFDFDRYNTAVLNDPDNPDREAALKYFASKKPDELETVVVGRTLKNKRTGETIGYDETWKEERDATREQRIAELNMRLDDQRLNREQQMELRRELAGQQAALRRDLAEQSSADRMSIARMTDSRATSAKPNKPLPVGALKLRVESQEMADIADGINGRLEGVEGRIASGKLSFGPIKNLTSNALNMAGMSTENSRNFASFKSELEKLRNDSLRLNKGVQTDGDAQRAWNEILANVTDTELVKQRLAEVKVLNERAKNLRLMEVDTINRNYGVAPMEDQPDAPEGRDAPPAKPAVKARTIGTFDLPPNAKQYEGKTLRDTKSGKRFKAVGGKWQEVR